MAPGGELWIETAQDGFDVSVERLVKAKSGDLVDHYVFTNHYEPARNVMVVGSKGLTPTATPGSVTPTAIPVVATPTVVAASNATSSRCRLNDGRIQVPPVGGIWA